MPERILIVDDEDGMRLFLAEAVSRMGYVADEAATAQEALDKFRAGPIDLVIMDVMLPDADGIETSRRLYELDPRVVTIVITADGSKDVAFRAIETGAYDFFTKPIRLEEFKIIVKRGLERRRWLLAEGDKPDRQEFPELIGESAAMQTVRKTLSRVIPTNVTVLILGETGTGKELIARTIHNHSPRHGKPFVEMNCAAIPEGLLESELFGHEKGAFTGATARNIGKFEFAHTGTIFLDEIGDMSLSAQAKTLRVIEDQTIRRVGGTESRKVDVRVIAATNRDLSGAIRQNQFRADLFFRLNVFPVQLPPLRERSEDLDVLAKHFLTLACVKAQKAIRRISTDALEALRAYAWPGNVRELKSCLEWAAVMAESDVITKSNLPQTILEAGKPESPASSVGGSLRDAINTVERDLVVQALRANRGHQAEAARQLGVSERTVWYLVKKHGIDVLPLKLTT